MLGVDPPRATRSLSSPNIDIEEHDETSEVDASSDDVVNDQSGENVTNARYRHTLAQSRLSKIVVLPAKFSEAISLLGKRSRQQFVHREIHDEWKTVARIADRVFLILLCCILFGLTIYILP